MTIPLSPLISTDLSLFARQTGHILRRLVNFARSREDHQGVDDGPKDRTVRVGRRE